MPLVPVSRPPDHADAQGEAACDRLGAGRASALQVVSGRSVEGEARMAGSA